MLSKCQCRPLLLVLVSSGHGVRLSERPAVRWGGGLCGSGTELVDVWAPGLLPVQVQCGKVSRMRAGALPGL